MSGLNPKIHHRRSLRMMGYDYSLAGAYFVTIATHQRKLIFGHIHDGKIILNPYGNIASEQWIRLQRRFYPSDFSTFITMPNHIHGIIHIARGVLEGFEQTASRIPPQRPEVTIRTGAGEGLDYASTGIPPSASTIERILFPTVMMMLFPAH